ncbi:caspase domain-containing protein [Chitinophaga niastensis]|uniref:Caspase domain-containing protein n=1 Tax=Chitinophaga niastensis TaxID=536980 RepID=A0A2P8HD20_CHINA|nr:caspase family protein [Chitinophaga niastensis]PSL44140.1 caspase domain-containing protein [Chitinophaga niastensis]
MKKCAVIIGVNEVKELAPLKAAVSGAYAFNTWALKQGYETTPITDDNGPVKLSMISSAVKSYVQKEIYEQLVIFFSGHGTWKSVQSELWLLSDAVNDSNEAINLSISCISAEFGNIPHVVFISDACRTISSDPLLSQVYGGNIFPTVFGNIVPEVDRFHATRGLSPAYERDGEKDNIESFGVYTKCILNGLYGNDEKIFSHYVENGKSFKIIRPKKLKTYLEEVVPSEVSKYKNARAQQPVAHVQSQYPKYLAKFSPSNKEGPAPSDLVNKSDELYLGHEMQNKSEMEGVRVTENVTPYIDSRLYKSWEQYAKIVVPDKIIDFWNLAASIIVDGADDIKINPDWPSEYQFTADSVTFIGIPSFYQSSFLQLRLKNGNGIPITILSGFVVIVLLKNEQVSNIRYEPSRNSAKYLESAERKPEILSKRAIISTAMQFGDFRITGEAHEVIRQAGYLRYDKAFDPTLGLYASYAYAQQGQWTEIESIYGFMKKEPEPILYDVELLNFLARYKTNRKTRFNERRSMFEPGPPLLTQGWSYFPIDFSYFPPLYTELIRNLVPGLWTTFTEAGAHIISHELR